MAEKQIVSALIKEQLPEFFKEEDSSLPDFLEKYYEFLECTEIHFIDLVLNEYAPILEESEQGIILLEDSLTDSIILESFRDTTEDAFIISETIIGSTSGATAKVTGFQKYGTLAGGLSTVTPHHLFVRVEKGFFIAGETFTGSANRTIAKIGSVEKKGPIQVARDLETINDIYETPDEFLEYFRKEFIPNIPRTAKQDIRKLITLANEIYRTRGSESSYNWLWRSIYDNENLEFFYPKDYVLRLNDGNWSNLKSVTINRETAIDFGYFAGRQITGSTSGATAIVESLIGTSVVELYLSNILGTFITGETIIGVTSENITPSGTLLSVVVDISITDGGTSYEVGNKITLTGGGAEAAAEIATVTTGAINNIIIDDGGDGYLANETIAYFEYGTGGSGGSARVGSIEPRGIAKTFAPIINELKDTALDSSNFGGITGWNINSHIYSDANNTFSATVSDTSNFAAGQYVTDTANDVIGTIVSVPDDPSDTLIYALIDTTKPNFVAGTNPSNIKAYNADNTEVSDAEAIVSAIAVESNTAYQGPLTVTEHSYGAIKTIDILAVGANYLIKPTLSATQGIITNFNNVDELLGPKSKFLNFSENIIEAEVNKFRSGELIVGETSGAKGKIIDPVLENTANSTFSTLRFITTPTSLVLDSTDGTSNQNENILLEDGFDPTHGSYSSTTSINGQFILEDLDFVSNEKILQVGSLINSPSSSTNTVTIDTTLRGNNASILVGDLSIGSISSIDMKNFGLGYATAPTATAEGGDGNAQLVATLGSLAEYPGSYTNQNGLISGKDKIQDSYYYQDFSYVLKTDISITDFKDTVKSFIHPAGWALFGEIAFRSTMTLPTMQSASVRDLIIVLPPFNVNYLAVEVLLETIQILLIVPTQAILPPPEGHEFMVRFRIPGTLNVGYQSSAIVREVETKRLIDISHIMASLDDKNQIEFILSTSLTPNITEPLEVVQWDSTVGQAFSTAHSNIIRTQPTIAEFMDWYNTSASIEELDWYGSMLLSEIIKSPQNINIGDEIYIDDVNLVLEDTDIDGTSKLLVLDRHGLLGDQGIGDNMLLEDGLNISDASYDGEVSAQGNIGLEADRFVYEDVTYTGNIDDKIKLWQKEEAKYIVQAVGDYSFTIYNADNTYLPVDLLSLITQDYRTIIQ